MFDKIYEDFYKNHKVFVNEKIDRIDFPEKITELDDLTIINNDKNIDIVLYDATYIDNINSSCDIFVDGLLNKVVINKINMKESKIEFVKSGKFRINEMHINNFKKSTLPYSNKRWFYNNCNVKNLFIYVKEDDIVNNKYVFDNIDIIKNLTIILPSKKSNINISINTIVRNIRIVNVDEKYIDDTVIINRGVMTHLFLNNNKQEYHKID